MREESHLEDMRSAIRGDFDRLAERRGAQELMRVPPPVDEGQLEPDAVDEGQLEPDAVEEGSLSRRTWIERLLSRRPHTQQV